MNYIAKLEKQGNSYIKIVGVKEKAEIKLTKGWKLPCNKSFKLTFEEGFYVLKQEDVEIIKSKIKKVIIESIHKEVKNQYKTFYNRKTGATRTEEPFMAFPTYDPYNDGCVWTCWFLGDPHVYCDNCGSCSEESDCPNCGEEIH